MTRLIGVFFLLVVLILVSFAVLGGIPLSTFGTILVGILSLLGIVFLK